MKWNWRVCVHFTSYIYVYIPNHPQKSDRNGQPFSVSQSDSSWRSIKFCVNHSSIPHRQDSDSGMMFPIIVIVNYLLRKLCGYLRQSPSPLPAPSHCESTDNWQHARKGKNCWQFGKPEADRSCGSNVLASCCHCLVHIYASAKIFFVLYLFPLMLLLLLLSLLMLFLARWFGPFTEWNHRRRRRQRQRQRRRRRARQRQTTLSCRLALGFSREAVETRGGA